MEAIFVKKNRSNYGRYWSDDIPEEESPRSDVMEPSPLKSSLKKVKKEPQDILFDDVFVEYRKQACKCIFDDLGEYVHLKQTHCLHVNH